MARSEATKQSSWPAAFVMTGAKEFARLPVRAVDGLLWLYQKLVSPALHAVAPACGCRFAPTCSHYARAALREHGLLAGLALSTRRLAKCGPWHPGGLDPVPPRQLSCTRVSPASAAGRSLLTHPPRLVGARRSLS